MPTDPIAIYGATGHTGALAATELLARGYPVVLGGRNPAALVALAEELGAPERVVIRPAALDDPAALREFTASAPVLVHCAGPYSQTGEPLVQAALETGTHYVDHAVEVHHVKHLFDAYGSTAERVGVAVCPGLSFYGGFGDLLAAATAEGLPEVEKVTVAYAVSGWRMTPGAKHTAEQLINEVERVTFSAGKQRVGPLPMYQAEFEFPPPLGARAMIGPFPTGDAVTIPRHVPTRAVEVLLTASTFAEPQVFNSEFVDARERALTEFTVAVKVATAAGSRIGRLAGQDIWWAGVAASVEAALGLVGGSASRAGVLSPAEAVPAWPFLRRLEALGAFALG